MTADVVSGQSVFVLDKDQNLEDVHTRCLPPSRLVIYTSRRTRHAGRKQAPSVHPCVRLTGSGGQLKIRYIQMYVMIIQRSDRFRRKPAEFLSCLQCAAFCAGRVLFSEPEGRLRSSGHGI